MKSVVADRQLAARAAAIFRNQNLKSKRKDTNYATAMQQYREMWEIVNQKESGEYTLNTALAMFCKSGRYNWVSDILKKMNEKNVSPTTSTFTNLISICRTPSELQQLHCLSLHFKLTVDSMYFNGIVSQAKKMNAFHLSGIDVTPLQHINPFIVTTCLTSLTNPNEVISVLHRFDAEGITCSEIMYAAAITGMRYSDSVFVYNEVIERGDSKIISNEFLSVLLTQADTVEDLMRTLKLSQSNNVPLSPSIISSIITCAINLSENEDHNQLGDIIIHVTQLIFLHSYINPIIISRLMTFYSTVGDLSAAESLFDHVSSYRIEPLAEFFESYSKIPGSNPDKVKLKIDWKQRVV